MLLFLMLTALAAGPAAAQAPAPGDAPSPAPKKAARPAKAVGDPSLDARLADFKTAYRDQIKYGRGFKLTWDKFWTDVHKDRTVFAERLAKQRANLIASLESLDKTAHPATIADFDKLQKTQITAFEKDLAERMSAFFATQLADFKKFGADQEASRAGSAATADESWKAWKAQHGAK